MKKIIIFGLIGMLVGLVVMNNRTEKTGDGVRQVKEVRVVRVKNSEGKIQYRATATVHANNEALLGSELSGSVTMYVEEGDTVASGQIIARINAPDVAARTSQARTAVAEAEAFERQMRRKWKDLKPEERERIRLGTESARLALQEASSYTAKSVIRAPFAGTVIAKYTETGTTVLQGAPIAKIADVSGYEAVVAVPQEIARSIEIGDSVYVEDGNLKKYVHVRNIARQADDLSQKTRITIDIPKDTDLRNGDLITALFTVHPNGEVYNEGVSVPVEALRREYDDTFVFVERENKAKQVRVDVRFVAEDRAIVQGDIYGDEYVIVTRVHELSDGEEVRIQ